MPLGAGYKPFVREGVEEGGRDAERKQSSRSGNESFSDLLSFPSLSHHRTCRSAYGGLIRFQRVANHVRLVSSSVSLNFRFQCIRA